MSESGCKYCNGRKETENVCEPLLSTDIKIKGQPVAHILTVVAQGKGKTKKHVLLVDVANSSGDSFLTEQVKISYCPVCGRKL